MHRSLIVALVFAPEIASSETDAPHDTVIVLGSTPSIESTPASAKTRLPSEHISRRHPEHLMQSLESVPGINQVSEGHAAVPAVRGLARGRTLVLIDGARVTSERRVGPSATYLDPATIENIEMARGPGSVAYGSDALGGVISVRTRRAPAQSGLQARVSGTVGTGVPDRSGSITLSNGFERGGLLLQAHAREAKNYESPDGEVLNSGWKDHGFLLNTQHELGPGLLSVGLASDFARDVERPRNNSQTVRFYYPFENSHRLTASYELLDFRDFERLSITGFLGTFEQRTDQDRFARGATRRSIERADVSAKDFHLKASAERHVGSGTLQFGVDANGRLDLEAFDSLVGYDAAGTIADESRYVSVDDADRLNTGIYVQGDMPVSELVRISGGVRFNHVSTKNSGGYFGDRSISHSAASGFGAVTIEPYAGLSLTAQVSRGFRDPTLSDRYFRGPSGRGFVTGNPDLDPEKSNQLDLAIRYTFGRTQVGLYGYQYRISGLIERYQAEPDFFFFRNRGNARLRGVELEASTDLGAGYSVEVGAQLARGTARDDGTSLDDISSPTFSVLARKELADRGYIQIRAAYLAKDDRPGPSEVATPGATILDIGAGWRVSRHVQLQATVRNLLDEKYYASPDPRWVYAPGRSASLTAIVQF